MRDGMLLDGGSNDNAYHYNSHSTLKTHLLSRDFSITSKKSSTLSALHKKLMVAVN